MQNRAKSILGAFLTLFGGNGKKALFFDVEIVSF